MGKNTKRDLFRAALNAAARSMDPTAEVTRAVYRPDPDEYVFDLERGGKKEETLRYSREFVDDFLDQIASGLGVKDGENP